MNKTLKTTLTLSLVVLLAACSNTAPKDSHAGHNHGPASPKETSTPAVAASLKDSNLNAVYKQYQLLTTALTEGDAATAKVSAMAIEAGAQGVKGGTALATTAAQITAAKNLDTQRTLYATLNNHFIALLKDTGLESGELYVAHCPMALNDKGASWVSQVKEIRNPYFGESMLTCGSVTETLN
ncbi:hypothetical protein IWX76_000539 [Pedobacter sp. CAN_A7]|uniref:DUF3347 domain-containing protein n=1 Tax=Pedobacter sp. CAN_A7 TaxID=2787722 RepID=UPI0018CA1D68